MDSKLIFSILTPSIPERFEQVQALSQKLTIQMGDGVEHLILMDNRKRTIGEKRDALLRAARGKYVAFVDDDDDVEPDYVASILEAAKGNPDVITFWQSAYWNDLSSQVRFSLYQQNQPFNHGGVTQRNAWHVCAWRRLLATRSSYPASNYGEDWAFAERLCQIPGLIEKHIPKVLHTYRHSEKTTAAPPPKF